MLVSVYTELPPLRMHIHNLYIEWEHGKGVCFIAIQKLIAFIH